MKTNLFLIIAITFIISSCDKPSPTTNVLLNHSNELIPFDKIDKDVVKNSVNVVLQVSEKRIEQITSIPSGERTFLNTAMAFDELQYELFDLISKLTVIGNTYEDDSTRTNSLKAAETLNLFITNLYLNEGLYKSLTECLTTVGLASLKPSQQKFLLENIKAFEKNGMKLDKTARDNVKRLNEKLAAFSTQFEKNLNESKDSVVFEAVELKGVPGSILNEWKNKEGKYVVLLNDPNFNNVLTYAESEKTRQLMFVKYRNRAYPANIGVLDSLFYCRQQLASQLGFSSYAAYALVDKMAKETGSVWTFLNDLKTKLTPTVKSEFTEYRKFKKNNHPELTDVIQAWDVQYYKRKILESDYQLNGDTLKQYFEIGNVMKGMFTVYEKLLDVEIKEMPSAPVWSANVKAYELYQRGKLSGRFYLDLFPRPNKYTWFACFPISQYRIVGGQEILPVTALLCNFPEGSKEHPSLLRHSQVITLFHEFGHLIHALVGRSDIAMQGPFFTKGDFVEAPSQFLENWCWQYESLTIFAKHFKSGKPLPIELYEKMLKSQKVGLAAGYLSQVSGSILDLTYHDKYDSIKKMDISKVAETIFPISQLPYAEGSHYICSFTHLNGYAANIYGYLWSRVFATDIFSEFKKNGIMDQKTGIRYRQEILEKAATKDETDLMRDFLKREPNSNAFYESLGIKNN